ncbi:FAD/NAD-P-binding domain-containing protein [Cubamyces sp. BRFM 1775]|nr:FAD/NAD-P-binding domain-containing protein [Cubamyces sp. BRFM 1775]
MTFDPKLVASSWLAALASASHAADVSAFGGLFLPDGWLRDVLAFTWDLRSLQGRDTIEAYLSNALSDAQIAELQFDSNPHLQTETSFIPQIHAIDVELAFTFECRNGHGRGYARLLPDQDGTFRAFTVMMMLSDLRGHEELATLPLRDDLTGIPGRDMQKEIAEWTREVETQPHVLIVGGAQAGLQLAARFKAMKIPTLVIEQYPRIGDVWRKRYPTLTLHTIKKHHSLLYQPFPTNWPEYTPRDKLADWLEHYASIQDLMVWTSSELQPKPLYDAVSGTWDVTVLRGGRQVKLRPAHIVVATGTLGKPYMPDIEGRDNFQGQILHSDRFGGGAHYVGKDVVVVGAGNSSIDICQDLVFSGAQSVTMIQRSSTCIMSRDFISMVMRSTWGDELPVDVADFKAAAWPFGLQKKLSIATEGAMWEAEKDLHDKLRKGGVQLNMGPEGQGLYLLVLERFGGYWQDKGGADLIANGSIKVKSGVSVERLTESGLILSDGSELSADAIIFATGYVPMKEVNRKLFGDEIVDHTADIYGLDAEGELRGSYRPSGQPGLWYATGDFFISRFNSKPLALQIKARQLGIVKD